MIAFFSFTGWALSMGWLALIWCLANPKICFCFRDSWIPKKKIFKITNLKISELPQHLHALVLVRGPRDRPRGQSSRAKSQFYYLFRTRQTRTTFRCRTANKDQIPIEEIRRHPRDPGHPWWRRGIRGRGRPGTPTSCKVRDCQLHWSHEIAGFTWIAGMKNSLNKLRFYSPSDSLHKMWTIQVNCLNAFQREENWNGEQISTGIGNLLEKRLWNLSPPFSSFFVGLALHYVQTITGREHTLRFPSFESRVQII